jgi:hypothetical protein
MRLGGFYVRYCPVGHLSNSSETATVVRWANTESYVDPQSGKFVPVNVNADQPANIRERREESTNV